MKSRYQLCWVLILYLLELSIVSSTIDQAAERHIDDVDVHFQEYHLDKKKFRQSILLELPLFKAYNNFSLPIHLPVEFQHYNLLHFFL